MEHDVSKDVNNIQKEMSQLKRTSKLTHAALSKALRQLKTARVEISSLKHDMSVMQNAINQLMRRQ